MKILFICKDRGIIPGYTNHSYGLWNSATFIINYLNRCTNVEAILKLAKDYNSVDKIVCDNNADIVIIEALWIIPSKLDELIGLKRHKKRIWIVRTHSQWSFFANEGIALEWLYGYKQLQDKYPNKLYIAPNTKNIAYDMQRILGLSVLYLPNIYCPDTPQEIYKHYRIRNRTIKIGSFGAIRPLKNQLIQAFAAISLAESLKCTTEFHINSTRIEQRGDPILKNIRALFNNGPHTLVEHKWENHDVFIDIVKQMDLGFQISYTETFNIVAADFVWNAKLLIGSPSIWWLPIECQANPNSLTQIVQTAKKCWTNRDNIIIESMRNLSKQNRYAANIWLKTLHI